jgi:hypothetical protein
MKPKVDRAIATLSVERRSSAMVNRNKDNRPSREWFYTTPEWVAVRKVVLHRDGFKCWYCGKVATTVDHLKPKSLGGTESLDNLVAACKPCNSSKKAKWTDRLALSRDWEVEMDTPHLQFDQEPAARTIAGREPTEAGREAEWVRKQLEAHTNRWAMIKTFTGADAKEEAQKYLGRVARPGFRTALRETNPGQFSVYGMHTGVINRRPRKPKDVDEETEPEGAFS